MNADTLNPAEESFGENGYSMEVIHRGSDEDKHKDFRMDRTQLV